MFEKMLQQLIAIPSHSGQEVEIAAFISNWVRQHAPSLSVVEQSYNATGRNVIVLGPDPTLLIDVHLDTVPPSSDWTGDPLLLQVAAERYSGLGAVDNKSALALCLELMATVDCSQAAFSFCGREEINAAGLKYLLASGALPKSIQQAAVMEPTQLNVITSHKGVGVIKAHFTGAAAHASDPSQGSNAIFQAAAFVQALESSFPDLAKTHPLLGSNTINIGQITGGTAPNVVASQCLVTSDVRTLPGQTPSEIVAIFETIAERKGIPVQFTTDFFVPPLEYHGDHRLVQTLLTSTGGEERAGHYWGHSGLYDEAGIESVLFGPGKIEQAHGAGEYIEKKQIEGAKSALRALVESL